MTIANRNNYLEGADAMAVTKEFLEQQRIANEELFKEYVEKFDWYVENGWMYEAHSVARVGVSLPFIEKNTKDYKRLFKFGFGKIKKEWVEDYEKRFPRQEGGYKNMTVKKKEKKNGKGNKNSDG